MIPSPMNASFAMLLTLQFVAPICCTLLADSTRITYFHMQP